MFFNFAFQKTDKFCFAYRHYLSALVCEFMEKVSKPLFQSASTQDIFQHLRREVNVVVQQLEPRRRSSILFKTFFFPALYIGVYLAALAWGNHPAIWYSCYFLLGLLLVFIFLNIIHDAVHGSIFKNRRLNHAFVYFFDLMGANSFIWKIRHIRYHHNYPNVNGWDTDIEQSELFRVFPSGGYSRFHRYQHIYMPLLYPLFLFNWLVVRDFRDFFNRKKTVRKLITIPVWEYVKLVLFKAFFFFYMIVLPVLVLGISWAQAIGGFLVMVFTASLFALFVLLPPHANTESAFPLPDENNRLPDSWFLHMMKTTNDITHDNWFTRFFMGCFNYHVAHHLFPHINHVYYPEVTEVLKKYAAQYQLPYRQFPLFTLLRKHYELLKQNRMPFTIFEETM